MKSKHCVLPCASRHTTVPSVRTGGAGGSGDREFPVTGSGVLRTLRDVRGSVSVRRTVRYKTRRQRLVRVTWCSWSLVQGGVARECLTAAGPHWKTVVSAL
ncbi:hypothetical protein E2C01_005341 [Portunus trituberculatus]|uniref:Uncharacterized protein n=1 Tax=Portunus trituberculatus TaxID=210409 RepID=A0A5B7CSA2_PORTR|nr:hypothetical protein [Portunus trituberculatus]